MQGGGGGGGGGGEEKTVFCAPLKFKPILGRVFFSFTLRGGKEKSKPATLECDLSSLPPLLLLLPLLDDDALAPPHLNI